MTEQNKIPLYNLRAVLHETGLKADLLRAWERRYDLPKPQRTEGGHRLYSAFDIDVIKWLMNKQAEGLTISRAVDLWHTLVDAGEDPLTHLPQEDRSPTQEHEANTNSSIDRLRCDWVRACLDFNSARSEEILNQAFALHPVETVCTEIMEKGLHAIGNGWYEDRVSVQQEHFASSLASRRLQTLISMTPPPNRRQTILMGCPTDELHTLPVLQMDLFLRRQGLKIINLGADVPIDQMVNTVLQLKPDLIIMAAQTLRTAANLQETFLALQSLGKRLAYGGLIFNRVPALRERIPAVFLGEEIMTSVSVVESLLAKNLRDTFAIPENPYQELVQSFMEQRVSVEMQVIQTMHGSGLPISFLNEANYHFGNDVFATLRLGNPDWIEADLEWVLQLLSSRNISHERLQPYLKAYRDAIQHVLGDQGAPVTRWLDTKIQPTSLLRN